MKKNSPSWIPCPGAWMRAILLTVLMGAIAISIKPISQPFSQFLAQHLPHLQLYFALLSALLPIFLIAIAHHGVHLFLDRFFPDSQASDMDRTEGFFPGLLSWWEGLYGWLVIVISTILTLAIIVAFHTNSSGYALLYQIQALAIWDDPKHLFSGPVIVRTIFAAGLYQFEHLVRCRLKT